MTHQDGGGRARRPCTRYRLTWCEVLNRETSSPAVQPPFQLQAAKLLFSPRTGAPEAPVPVAEARPAPEAETRRCTVQQTCGSSHPTVPDTSCPYLHPSTPVHTWPDAHCSLLIPAGYCKPSPRRDRLPGRARSALAAE